MSAAAQGVGPALQAAAARLRAGDPAAAAALLEALPPAERERADVQHLLGRCAGARGDHLAAVGHARHAAALAPGQAELHYTLGLHALDAQRAPLALDAFDAAIRCRPEWPAAHINRGIALQDLGRHREAIAAFDRALALVPTHAGACNNRAVSLLALGEWSAAESAAARARQLAPLERGYRINHLETLLAAGQPQAAAAELHDLLAQPGGNADAADLTRLGEALLRWSADALVDTLLDSAALAPAAAADWLAGLAARAEALGETSAARRLLAQALARQPDHWPARVQQALLLDEVHDSPAALRAARERYAAGLAALRQQLVRGPVPPPEELLRGLRRSPFLLAYQGGDDRPLQEAYGDWLADCWQRADPALARHRPRGPRAGRIRVGYIGAHFRDCTVGHYFRSWITLPAATGFDKTLLITGGARDAVTDALSAACDRTIELAGRDLRAAARQIAALQLDVLIYPELGMASDTYPLAALRLAPLQCAGWGHPVTTGLSTIDRFVSSAAAEPTDAEAHYRERLVRLPGLGTCYAAPPPPTAIARAALGLPPTGFAWFYPHSPFKVHPAGDAALMAVLARTPGSVLVLVDGPTRAGTRALRHRLEAAARAQGVEPQRLIGLPALPRAGFLAAAAACDAMLDPWHWSGGQTSLDALCAGLPIVTLPGEFMRGRQSAAMLQILDLHELIAGSADEYVAIALRLAGDAAWRHGLRQRIVARRGALFDDPAPVIALTDFLQREVARCRAEAAA